MPGGRPRLPAGSFGSISVKEIEPGKWRARVVYRDDRGNRREATKVARTKKMAENRLQDLMAGGLGKSTAIAKSTTIAELAEHFLETKAAIGRAPQTLEAYRKRVSSTVVPKIGNLALSDATPKRMQEFLLDVAAENGPSAAKSCRAVLSGMFSIAVVNDVITTNPIAGVQRIRQKSGARGSRALKLSEVEVLRQKIANDAELKKLDIADLLVFMSWVGNRIGEALALRAHLVDLSARTVTLGPTVSRVTGQGLTIHEPAKNASATSDEWRTIVVPAPALEILERRLESHAPHNELGLIFPSVRGHLRDPQNTERDWRNHRARLGFPDFKPHGFRKTVATLLDGAGMSARDVAEYLGHKNPSMTQDVYMAKNTGSARIAESLEAMRLPTNSH